MKKKLSIIIPTYNEGKYLPILLKKINNVNLSKFKLTKEIIIVNDGSTDNTNKILKKFKNIILINQKNRGKGYAVQAGIKKSTGQIILIQDADLEYDPKDYINLLKPFFLKKKIAVFGSRYLKKNIFSYNFLKPQKQNYLNFFFNFIISVYFFLFYKNYITDLLTGFKVYEKNFFYKNKINSTGFEADHEITIKLLKNNYKIVEIPIKYNPRTKSEGKKINILDAFKALFIIAKMKIK